MIVQYFIDGVIRFKYNNIEELPTVGSVIKVPNVKLSYVVLACNKGPIFMNIQIREAKILECSSKGDKRFSAFYAQVPVHDKMDSIENHYQRSKRFKHPDHLDNENVFISYMNATDAKGKTPVCFMVDGFMYSLSMLSMWYKLLWMKYLDHAPALVEYASGYDDFHDMFKGKSVNCQADVIRQYIKEGRQSIVDDCIPLIWAMRENNKSKEETI